MRKTVNNIEKAFQRGTGLIPFLTVGYPNEALFIEIVLLLAQKGCSLIEIGFPFSDPIADGPVIQRTSQKVLDGGMNTDKAFRLIQKIRSRTDVPLAVMTYRNILQDIKSFVCQSVDYGVDGLIIPDMIIEETDSLCRLCEDKVSLTFFVSRLTSKERREQIFHRTTGFVYCLSRLGVTGIGGVDIEATKNWIEGLRRETDKRLAVGFGLSKQEDIQRLRQVADGVIIGSALISQIDSVSKPEKILDRVSCFIDSMTMGFDK